MSNSTATASDRSLVITRRVRATPEEVFDAWTDAEGMRTWMAPGPTKHARATLDPRVGGKYQIDMVGAEATFEHHGEYLVVDRPRKLSFTWVSAGTQQQRSVVTVELKAVGGTETELTLTHEDLPNAESAANHKMGWASIVEKFAEHVER